MPTGSGRQSFVVRPGGQAAIRYGSGIRARL